jgi:hypothetical protein
MPRGIYKRTKPIPEERKKRISKTLTGRKRTKRSIEKQKLSRIGSKHSDETKRKNGLAHSGEKCHWWKGGITPLRMLIKNCFKHRLWRSDIFTRDDFTCVLCNKRGGRIEVDHYPKKFSTILFENKIKTLEDALNCEEFWNINNGRTVCRNCHIKLHKGRINKNNKK